MFLCTLVALFFVVWKEYSLHSDTSLFTSFWNPSNDNPWSEDKGACYDKIQLQNKGLGKKEINKWRLHGSLVLKLIINNGRGGEVEFVTA